MEATDLAAAANQVQVLRWIRSQNCPWGGLKRGPQLSVGATVTPATVQWILQAGCPLQPVRLLQDAAAGGNGTLVAWLLRDGGPAVTFIDEGLVAAARGGHVAILDSLLVRRQQLLQQQQTLGLPQQYRPPQPHGGGRMDEGGSDGVVGGGGASSFTHVGELVAAAAEGCGLELLKRLHATFVSQPGDVCAVWREKAAAAAAGSTTLDWAAKLEWLLSLGYPVSSSSLAAFRAASSPDALSRLTWLRAHGCDTHADPAVAVEAACAGRLDALRWWLRPPPPPPTRPGSAACSAAASTAGRGMPCCGAQQPLAPAAVAGPTLLPRRLGQAHLLQLAERGCGPEVWELVLGGGDGRDGLGHTAVTEELLIAAVGGGNVRSVTWLLDFAAATAASAAAARSPAGAAAPDGTLLTAALFAAAAGSASTELLAELRARGCPWGPGAYLRAAEAGAAACLEWLAAHGCPRAPDSLEPGQVAARAADLGTLQALGVRGRRRRPRGLLQRLQL
ncbi:hypothetical protein HXX76_011444 [Chlamydomonas incerta]|uniref:Ankyrin repeat domain-containing protein n=1 Tax=Chlamydomonas incerta TaxID=51695 RepID=A0A835VXJ3_CHLIN|nr:hypothetical protein HXX76_011444 [Chlamydomonas incerta]|eukprot:KAG2428741.1 hypothetical protein HXX76_011444 [Chlamydomonas incerta]